MEIIINELKIIGTPKEVASFIKEYTRDSDIPYFSGCLPDVYYTNCSEDYSGIHPYKRSVIYVKDNCHTSIK